MTSSRFSSRFSSRCSAHPAKAIAFVLAAAFSTVVGCAAGSSSGGFGGNPGSGGATSGGAGGSGVNIDGGTATDAGYGAGGSTGAAGSAGGLGGATDAGSSGCVLTITPVVPSSFANVEAGPGAQVRVQGSVRGAKTSPPVWVWTVTSESATGSIPTTAIDSPGTIVEFPIETVGRYQVMAQIEGEPLCVTSIVIYTVAPGPMVYVLRTSAPQLPVQDVPIMLAATDPQPPANVQLQAGVAASLFPQRADQNGGSLASYVRITDPASALSVDGDSASGPVLAPLLPSLTYDVLIVPTEPYAPNLLSGTPGSWPQPLQLDRGVPVTATTLDGAGNPVVGTRMVLRRGALPSTVGISDTTGALALLARGGTLAAYLVPPVDSGLPSAAVGAGTDPTTDPGILLDPGVTSLALSMTWDPVTRAALSINVLAPGGAAAVGTGARVRATAQAAAAAVGTLIVHPAGGNSVTLRATGTTDVEVVTDTNGTASFAALPLGAYTITIIPPSTTAPMTATSPGITTTSATLVAGGLSRNVTLSTKSLLQGTLLPLSDSPGTQVTAIDHTVTAAGAVVSATVAADGTYQLLVDPGRGYELLAQPPAGSARGRAVLATNVSNATPTIAPASLPIAHPVHGVVTSAAGTVGGALVQAFCPSTSSKCLDATFPLSEALTRADGSFDLLLPDPPGN